MDNLRLQPHLLCVAKPREIELPDGTCIPILYEDRSILALDKPAGWLMVPTSWEKTARNLQLALESSLNAGDFWAKSRNLKFLRFVHRLDADTSGVVLFVKSPGAMAAYSEVFESRAVEKTYLAVVDGVPTKTEWTTTFPIAPVPDRKGKMQPITSKRTPPDAKDAETEFRLLKAGQRDPAQPSSTAHSALLLARPKTGRTHQIRVHLAAGGHPVRGDNLYGRPQPGRSAPVEPLALRAIALAYRDPFTRKPVRIEAPFAAFLHTYGFTLDRNELFPRAERQMNTPRTRDTL